MRQNGWNCRTFRLAADLFRSMFANEQRKPSRTATIGYLAERDPTTRRMLEEILASEEEHAEDLSSLLEGAERLRSLSLVEVHHAGCVEIVDRMQ